jgi:hypothetical protein
VAARDYQEEQNVDAFEWAENNLGARTPHQLQDAGVNVYFAPNIAPNREVVNLANGQVEWFHPSEDRPGTGYYADREDLARFCDTRGVPLVETDGQLSTQSTGAS